MTIHYVPRKIVSTEKDRMGMGDSRTISEHYVTFGVQYTLDPERGELHPLGMHKDGYAVIEAPDLRTAQRIADAIFQQKYAFIYEWEEFMGEGMHERWYSSQEGPLLTIKWVQP